jgi:hypothetical protein
MKDGQPASGEWAVRINCDPASVLRRGTEAQGDPHDHGRPATEDASLHDRIEQVLEMHPELRDVTEGIALSQDRMWRSALHS